MKKVIRCKNYWNDERPCEGMQCALIVPIGNDSEIVIQRFKSWMKKQCKYCDPEFIESKVTEINI